MSYQYITKMNLNQIKKKSVLIIGSGYMAQQYSNSLNKMGINDVAIIGNLKNKVEKLGKKYDFETLSGGLK